MLTEQQVRQFHEEGYLFLPETFTPEEVAILSRRPMRSTASSAPRCGARNPARPAPPSPRISTMRHTACSPATRA